jgi:hypothetical protein
LPVAADTDAAHEIRAAWNACFRHQPQYDEAYWHAALAVESVATAYFTPKDGLPQLGKATDHLSRTLDRYSIAGLDDPRRKSAETLHSMLDLIRRNQDRHVSQGGVRPVGVSPAEAESVVYLAVTIVQLFQRGLVDTVDQA